MLPVVPTLVSSLGGTISSGVSGLIGDTATDKRREADADALLQRALAGDDAAVVALCYEAFERRSGMPGDPRTPVDGNYSPRAVRDLATARLKSYVAKRGGLPAVAGQWAAPLNAAVLPTRTTLAGQALGFVQEGIAQGVERATTDRIAAQASAAAPVVGVGLLLLAVGVGAYFLLRK